MAPTRIEPMDYQFKSITHYIKRETNTSAITVACPIKKKSGALQREQPRPTEFSPPKLGSMFFLLDAPPMRAVECQRVMAQWRYTLPF